MKKSIHGKKEKERNVSGVTYEYSDVSNSPNMPQKPEKSSIATIDDVSGIGTDRNVNVKSRGITGISGAFGVGIDNNLSEFLGGENGYQVVNMGAIDEEERPFMIIDKDTGRIYDMRNDNAVERLTNVATTRMGTQMPSSSSALETGNVNDTQRKTVKGTGSAWGDWWKQKKKSNQEFLWAAEVGDIAKLKKYISKEEMKDMVADINAKGLDQWTALHFCANSGHVEITKELLQHKVDLDAFSTIERTPLHMACLKGHTEIAKLLI